MRIEYVSHGLGNNFGNVIEINRNLKDYPELHDVILKHEFMHTDRTFSLKDLYLDMTESGVDNKKLLWFMLKHPLSFTQVLPFYWTKKHGFIYDINQIIFCLVLMGIISLAFII
jgi:hypothetical protein